MMIEQRMADLERRLAAVERQASEITGKPVEGEQVDVTSLAYRVAEIVRRRAPATPQRLGCEIVDNVAMKRAMR